MSFFVSAKKHARSCAARLYVKAVAATLLMRQARSPAKRVGNLMVGAQGCVRFVAWERNGMDRLAMVVVLEQGVGAAADLDFCGSECPDLRPVVLMSGAPGFNSRRAPQLLKIPL